MSQLNPPGVGLTTTQEADAFVKGLSAEAKRAVLLSLLRAGVRADDLPTPATDWRTMKVVPPVLTPEEVARIRALDPDDCVDAEEFFKQLDREDRD
jgi:hypothetical protein